jgi:Domain of unknown function (DUF4375)
MDKNIFLIRLSESNRTDFGKVDFQEQSEAQKVFSAIWELESQVNNGGFDQYFRNSDSDIIAFAPTALKSIGAKACARIVETAIKLISPIPSSQIERSSALDALGEKEQDKLESLDSKFLEYPDNLTELLFAHVAKHPEAFGPIPK